MHLLTLKQTKMLKSESYGYVSACLNLEPAKPLPANDLAIKNTCGKHGVCAKYCLKTTGRNRLNNASTARTRRTEMLFSDRGLFFSLLDADLYALKHRHDKSTVRLNCLSDLPWERFKINGRTVFDRHPGLQFLDYTKHFDRLSLQIPNYTLVYSYSERSNDYQVRNYLAHGGRVAMVFNSGNGELPEHYKIAGQTFEVVDGDTHDLLHLRPKGTILGLRYKRSYSPRTGKTQTPPNKFVVTL
jgi:hypothetical protein